MPLLASMLRQAQQPRSANANYSYFGFINEFAVNPTKDLNEVVEMYDVRGKR
jgi:hypothetical protein